MGEILGLGVTHFPPLAGRDEDMGRILERVLRGPALAEQYRQLSGWPMEALPTAEISRVVKVFVLNVERSW